MCKTENKQSSDEGVDKMSANLTQSIPRYCSVSESLRQSCEEVKSMREGKLLERTWDDLKKELNEMKKLEKAKQEYIRFIILDVSDKLNISVGDATDIFNKDYASGFDHCFKQSTWFLLHWPIESWSDEIVKAELSKEKKQERLNKKSIETYKSVYWQENNEDDAVYTLDKLIVNQAVDHASKKHYKMLGMLADDALMLNYQKKK